MTEHVWSEEEKDKWGKVKQICISENWNFDKVSNRLYKEFGWTTPQSYIATEQFWKSPLNPAYVNYN
jgi:hypothetical protein